MDIRYELPGCEGASASMRILLDGQDSEALQGTYHCTEPRGLRGSRSTTEVRYSEWVDEAEAHVAANGNLDVALPEGAVPPLIIPNERIHPPITDKSDRSAVERHFGPLGHISVRAVKTAQLQ